MTRIFVSFVHEDEKVALAVQKLLQTELELGKEVFLSSDKSQIYAGDLWLQKIKEGLIAAKNRHSHAEPTFCGPSVGQLRGRRRLASRQDDHSGLLR
jgi:hypothetical protein